MEKDASSPTSCKISCWACARSIYITLVPNSNMHLVPLTLPNPQNNILLAVMWCTHPGANSFGQEPDCELFLSLPPCQPLLKLVNVSTRHFRGDLRSRARRATQSPRARQPTEDTLHAAKRTPRAGPRAQDCQACSVHGKATASLQKDTDVYMNAARKGKLPSPELYPSGWHFLLSLTLPPYALWRAKPFLLLGIWA